ncbi:MAG: glycosyltransferase family 9 protein [Candidatus Omnitrophica bacterium]|nr:glycosyltransferase family 9 protein [Candidatus Omnitrophota bacterium]
MKKKRRVLIIKTGFSEFLDRGVSTTVSLGDVLFCTSVLHLYKDDDVTWVVSDQAKGLLENNPYINKLLVFDPFVLKSVLNKKYDVFINLEKDIGICAFLKDIQSKEKYGFYFDEKVYDIATYKDATRLLLSGQENHKNIINNTAEILYQVVGAKWDGQGLVLFPEKRKEPVYDVGLNYSVGVKWPTKSWSMGHWKMLEKLLKKDFSVSWQKGHKNIKSYIQWIDSCKVIVTSDSLGQMIGQALGKKVVTLFGPTNHQRMMGVPGIHVLPSRLKCRYRPCYMPFCRNKRFCMDVILPKNVEVICRRLLKK